MRIITKTVKSFELAYCSPDECEFHDIGSHIIVTTKIDGGTYCAFFDTRTFDIESIKRHKTIKLHHIYPLDGSLVFHLGIDETEETEHYSPDIMEALNKVLNIELDATKDSIRALYSTSEILSAVAVYEGLGGYAADMILGWVKDIYGIDLEEEGDYLG